MRNKEVWREISGYAGVYEISSFGQVRSYYNGRHGLRPDPKIIVLSPGKNGYLLVSLRVDGHPKTFTVHTLVLRTFVGPPPLGEEGCHDDGDKSNNRLDNLAWGTRSKNTKDQVRHGTFNYPVQYRWKKRAG